MRLSKPVYYDRFRCLAGDCPDTCCQQWDIAVDPDTLALYQSLPGPLGKKVRHSLHLEDGETYLSMDPSGHCPMQDPSGLCSLQAAFGPQALSQVCREFPRLHHDYGSFLELGLEMSCPEAARLLLTEPLTAPVSRQVPGGSQPEYDTEAMEVLLATRQQALSLLTDDRRSLGDRLILLFFYGVHAQALLDGEEVPAFDPEASLETAASMASHGSFREIPAFFSQEEILTSQWAALLADAGEPVLEPQVIPLAHYLVNRYWLQAVSDYDLYCRVKFILISCLLVSSLHGDFIRRAQLFSKEIENDIDNVDSILDAAYTDPLFTDDRLLGFLTKTPANPEL